MNKVCCDICGTPLGYVDLKEVKEPMTAEMFSSLMPERGAPPPFQPGQTWEMLYCRQCKHRAFHHRDRITLIDDKYRKKVIDINKIDIEHKTREANQSRIEIMFRDEAPTLTERFKDLIKPTEYECEICGARYKHQSSLCRHRKEAHD